jgi:hypothetical protein
MIAMSNVTTDVNALTRIAELQRGHIQGQRALIEDEKKLILSQRELIADHRGLVSDMMALSAQQWIMLEKAVWIISCLAVALISTSFLLASNSFHSRYWPTYRSWDTLSDFDTAIPDRMFWMPPWHSFNLASLLDGLSLVWLATNAIHQAFLALTISIFPVLPPGALVVWVVSTGLGRSHRLLVPTLSMFSPVGAGIFRAYVWGYWVESLLASTALDTVCMVGVIFMLQMAERKKALQN